MGRFAQLRVRVIRKSAKWRSYAHDGTLHLLFIYYRTCVACDQLSNRHYWQPPPQPPLPHILLPTAFVSASFCCCVCGMWIHCNMAAENALSGSAVHNLWRNQIFTSQQVIQLLTEDLDSAVDNLDPSYFADPSDERLVVLLLKFVVTVCVSSISDYLLKTRWTHVSALLVFERSWQCINCSFYCILIVALAM